MSVLQDPRLVAATSAPLTPQQLAHRIRSLQQQLAKAIIAAHHGIWPKEVNGRYTVTHYNGHAKVEFENPAIKEPGFRD